jgi:hypothetical protein
LRMMRSTQSIRSAWSATGAGLGIWRVKRLHGSAGDSHWADELAAPANLNRRFPGVGFCSAAAYWLRWPEYTPLRKGGSQGATKPEGARRSANPSYSTAQPRPPRQSERRLRRAQLR